MDFYRLTSSKFIRPFLHDKVSPENAKIAVKKKKISAYMKLFDTEEDDFCGFSARKEDDDGDQ